MERGSDERYAIMISMMQTLLMSRTDSGDMHTMRRWDVHDRKIGMLYYLAMLGLLLVYGPSGHIDRLRETRSLGVGLG